MLLLRFLLKLTTTIYLKWRHLIVEYHIKVILVFAPQNSPFKNISEKVLWIKNDLQKKKKSEWILWRICSKNC
jgi:hypothetical protein